MQEQLQSKTAAHTLPSWRARAICALLLCFSSSSLTCLTLQRINRATTKSIVACLPDFAAYINDDGQGRTAAFVSLDAHWKRSERKLRMARKLQPFSYCANL